MFMSIQHWRKHCVIDQVADSNDGARTDQRKLNDRYNLIFLKKHLELHIKSRDAVSNNQSLATDGIEPLAFSEKG